MKFHEEINLLKALGIIPLVSVDEEKAKKSLAGKLPIAERYTHYLTSEAMMKDGMKILEDRLAALDAQFEDVFKVLDVLDAMEKHRLQIVPASADRGTRTASSCRVVVYRRIFDRSNNSWDESISRSSPWPHSFLWCDPLLLLLYYTFFAQHENIYCDIFVQKNINFDYPLLY